MQPLSANFLPFQSWSGGWTRGEVQIWVADGRTGVGWVQRHTLRSSCLTRMAVVWLHTPWLDRCLNMPLFLCAHVRFLEMPPKAGTVLLQLSLCNDVLCQPLHFPRDPGVHPQPQRALHLLSQLSWTWTERSPHILSVFCGPLVHEKHMQRSFLSEKP